MSAVFSTGSDDRAADALAGNPAPPDDEMEEEFAEREFGFWIYLMTDSIIFALFFVTYVIMSDNIASGPAAKEFFSLPHTAGGNLLLPLFKHYVWFCIACRAGAPRLACRPLAGRHRCSRRWLRGHENRRVHRHDQRRRRARNQRLSLRFLYAGRHPRASRLCRNIVHPSDDDACARVCYCGWFSIYCVFRTGSVCRWRSGLR